MANSIEKTGAHSSGFSSDISEGGAQGLGSRGSDNFKGGNDNGYGKGDHVYSTPTKDMSLFWCPKRGLHVKQDWRVAIDN